MTPNEKKAYARGYNAGRRKQKADRSAENLAREREAFRDRVFVALLPTLIGPDGNTWTMGGQPVKTSDDRVKLAWSIARKAAASR